ncbi:macrophage migration inhibitory factor (MIF) [Marinifilum flexuosum]|uniref:L-dopachrome isomerase n=2 Tax=Marinifilum flexuosum TaxID=1117708 RepID=A0A419X342_9BACT|nr:macrophage migration inhibitory factor (MIF) [Marinifilum flexuosum]
MQFASFFVLSVTLKLLLMPYLKVQTNQSFSSKKQQSFLKESSALISFELGKPEKYVMTAFESKIEMTLGGSEEPVVFLQLKSIGLPDTKTKDLSSKFASLVEEQLKIPKDRVYIEFMDVPRGFWGWNGILF